MKVTVNECMVNATGQGARWWAMYRLRYEPIGRLTVVKASLGGDVVAVDCDDREHAEWLIDHATTMGIPRRAMKVTA